MKHRFASAAAALTLAATFATFAADDRFHKEKPGSMNGFLPAKENALYVKECGSCHFPYSPGMLPERSWKVHMDKLASHFGENVALKPDAHAAIASYLTENAADRSPYEGSKTLMERVRADRTPYRFQEIPLFRQMHTVVREVMFVEPKVRTRRLTNCNDCHQYADEGSFGTSELIVPGITPTTRKW
jgi:hypothetical protein